MNERDFQKLLLSARKASAERQIPIASPPNSMPDFSPLEIKAIREQLRKTQQEFAVMIGVSVGTLRNWEQGRRRPEGPAQALLRVAKHAPDVVAEALGQL